MLHLTIPLKQGFNEETNEFVILDGFEMEMEHSLVSLSKWESFYKKPFLGKESKTTEESLFYAQCMTLTPNLPPEIFQKFTDAEIEKINVYIKDPHSATTFGARNSRPSSETITSELIYYWMVAYNIPPEYQHWHLNRLLTLIRICNIKNRPAKKMTKSELAARNRELNAQRRAQYGTRG